jgi:hypothetical protein
MGRQLEDIMVGDPSIRVLAKIFPTSHHGQWGRMSFKISGEEG